VTPGDLLEAITGELQPVAQVDAWATPREDGFLAARWPDAGGRTQGPGLGIRELPDEERGRYNTVAGLLLSVSGHLPRVGSAARAPAGCLRWWTWTAGALTGAGDNACRVRKFSRASLSFSNPLDDAVAAGILAW